LRVLGAGDVWIMQIDETGPSARLDRAAPEEKARNTGWRREVARVCPGEAGSACAAAGETRGVRAALARRSIDHWDDGRRASSGPYSLYPLGTSRSVADLSLPTEAQARAGGER
jgi:hypothetical protein